MCTENHHGELSVSRDLVKQLVSWKRVTDEVPTLDGWRGAVEATESGQMGLDVLRACPRNFHFRLAWVGWGSHAKTNFFGKGIDQTR